MSAVSQADTEMRLTHHNVCSAETTPRRVVLCAIALVIAIDFGWYCLFASFFALPAVAVFYPRGKHWIDYVIGGISMLLNRRLAALK